MKNKLVPIARKLRRKQTPHEIKLWSLLRDRRFSNYKFRRQYPIENYIVDFFCFDKNLIIELDGGGHNDKKQLIKDKKRDEYLKRQGYTILRIWNNELDDNIDGVFQRIDELLKH